MNQTKAEKFFRDKNIEETEVRFSRLALIVWKFPISRLWNHCAIGGYLPKRPIGKSLNRCYIYFSGTTSYTAEVAQNSVFEHKSNGGRCPIAFHEIGGRCYFYGYFKLNWFRAMEFCHSFGASVSLACIESKEENDHLKKWLIQNGKQNLGVSPKNAHLAYFDRLIED